jgi:hypothetical protein
VRIAEVADGTLSAAQDPLDDAIGLRGTSDVGAGGAQ